MKVIIILLLLVSTAHAGINLSMTDKAMMTRTETPIPTNFSSVEDAVKWAESHKNEEFTRRRLSAIVDSLKSNAFAKGLKMRSDQEELTMSADERKRWDDNKRLIDLYIAHMMDFMENKDWYEKALTVFEKHKRESSDNAMLGNSGRGATVVSGSVPVKKER